MKNLVVLLVVGLVATAAGAGLDPDTDSFGVYFDTQGNQNQILASPFTPFNVYLLLMNPVGTTDGYECTVTPSGAPFFILSTTLPDNSLDVDASANGFAVGAAAPLPVADDAMLLCTWQYMMQNTMELRIFITEATVPSLAGGLPVVTGDGVLRLCGVASGDVELPVASVNVWPDATEVSTFGAVKSLFR